MRKPYLAAHSRKLGVMLLVALLMLAVAYGGVAGAQELPEQNEAEINAQVLLEKLRDASEGDAAKIATQIKRAWARSGSASVDLLLKRGRDALQAKKPKVAIEHLTALTDHAPDFAEG